MPWELPVAAPCSPWPRRSRRWGWRGWRSRPPCPCAWRTALAHLLVFPCDLLEASVVLHLVVVLGCGSGVVAEHRSRSTGHVSSPLEANGEDGPPVVTLGDTVVRLFGGLVLIHQYSLVKHGSATTGHAGVDDGVGSPSRTSLVAGVDLDRVGYTGGPWTSDVGGKHRALERRVDALGSVVTCEPAVLGHSVLLR